MRDSQPHTPWSIGDQITYERNERQYTLKFRPYGRLKLFLPYTVKTTSSRFVHFVLKTTSYYDCINIDANLAAIQNIANVLNHGNAAGIPIIIYRKLTDICWNHEDGTASREKKWLVCIEVDPEWVAGAIRRMSALALGQEAVSGLLPSGDTQHALSVSSAAPDPSQDDDIDEELDPVEPEPTTQEPQTVTEGEYTREEQAKPAKEKNTAEQQQAAKPERPYSPEVLKAKIAATKVNVTPELTAKALQEVPACLNHVLGGDGARHELLYWLTGHKSMKSMPPAIVIALWHWLKPVYDSNNAAYMADAVAAKEAGAAHVYALEAAGQAKLL